MPAADVIRRRGDNIQISRPGSITVTDGYAIPAADSTVTVFGVVQPLSGEEIRNLPPGENSVDWRNVWATTEIRVRDRLTADGMLFTIQKIEDWNAAPGGFWKGQAV